MTVVATMVPAKASRMVFICGLDVKARPAGPTRRFSLLFLPALVVLFLRALRLRAA